MNILLDRLGDVVVITGCMPRGLKYFEYDIMEAAREYPHQLGWVRDYPGEMDNDAFFKWKANLTELSAFFYNDADQKTVPLRSWMRWMEREILHDSSRIGFLAIHGSCSALFWLGTKLYKEQSLNVWQPDQGFVETCVSKCMRFSIRKPMELFSTKTIHLSADRPRKREGGFGTIVMITGSKQPSDLENLVDLAAAKAVASVDGLTYIRSAKIISVTDILGGELLDDTRLDCVNYDTLVALASNLIKQFTLKRYMLEFQHAASSKLILTLHGLPDALAVCFGRMWEWVVRQHPSVIMDWESNSIISIAGELCSSKE